MKNLIQSALFVFFITSLIISCNNSENKKEGVDELVKDSNEVVIKKEETINADSIFLETEFGNMRIKLYDATPKHKANFLKLARSGFYNDLLFHRVIKGFMIQGGDPQSKNATPDAVLGNGGPGYKIDAEFNKSLFHKKGMLAAAREGDQVNPQKQSSGSQFYIVQGKIYSEEELLQIEEQVSISNYFSSHLDFQKRYDTLYQSQDKAGIEKLLSEIKNKKDFVLEKIPYNKRTAYKEVGGTPFLDDAYTVFGEVIDGLDVIDKIANAETKPGDRPKSDIKMIIRVVEKQSKELK